MSAATAGLFWRPMWFVASLILDTPHTLCKRTTLDPSCRPRHWLSLGSNAAVLNRHWASADMPKDSPVQEMENLSLAFSALHVCIKFILIYNIYIHMPTILYSFNKNIFVIFNLYLVIISPSVLSILFNFIRNGSFH